MPVILAVVGADVLALLVLVVLARRAPLDPTWSDVRPPRRFFDAEGRRTRPVCPSLPGSPGDDAIDSQDHRNEDR